MPDTPNAEASTSQASTPEAPTPQVIAGRLAEITERIRVAGGDRPVTVIGVTKTFPLSYVEAALAAGIVDLGENYGQELIEKSEGAGDAGLEPRWHFIGGLQRNKVKKLAGHVWLWHTIDRAVLVEEVAKRDPGARILIQVNTTDEAQKSGCDPDEARALVDRGRELGLEVRGLMTIGPTGAGGSAGDPRPAFDRLRELGQVCEVDELSMGMSADYELAVAAGATMVRIGSAIFGRRSQTSAG